MDGVYDRRAPKRDITLSLDEDILQRAQSLPGDLSERVEKMLADEVAKADRERRLDATINALNDFDSRYGSFADEHLDHL
ncbi:type II toxin-antitoxin system CcdA family antitoxin [Azospirillum sp. YIM B02556]|uniref:Type II toxin-antitoxin system CcdA family antitoxin n=1 Tax=Azospirillum endophyticum TaxID=2800326 RepID=A0ABS1F4H6_9PROT|nr:type II toxin-antitoxin system CcdA family antitoxin [Azospirillum endophyticum]MBK1838328.1 type II toxin-antitoxin system CcdA family antitoxin [Azospirillum endophyticum]